MKWCKLRFFIWKDKKIDVEGQGKQLNMSVGKVGSSKVVDGEVLLRLQTCSWYGLKGSWWREKCTK